MTKRGTKKKKKKVLGTIHIVVSKATKGPWDPLSTVVKSGTFSFGIAQWNAIR